MQPSSHHVMSDTFGHPKIPWKSSSRTLKLWGKYTTKAVSYLTHNKIEIAQSRLTFCCHINGKYRDEWEWFRYSGWRDATIHLSFRYPFLNLDHLGSGAFILDSLGIVWKSLHRVEPFWYTEFGQSVDRSLYLEVVSVLFVVAEFRTPCRCSSTPHRQNSYTLGLYW